jgi:parallel beta-helix repeat protein
MLRLVLFASAAAFAAHPANARTIAVAAGADAQERLQQALLDAKPGDTVRLGPGVFTLTDGLSLDVDSVTVRGAGGDRTILDFKGQLGAGEGLLVTSDDVTLREFGVRDTKGDGIKSKGADRIVYKGIKVTWSGGPKETNGAYGIYPVSSRHVLIENSYVSGASDAGIYVGQSEDIVVRRNAAVGNVAGIEIENSNRADVYENAATKNTGGILVFDLPNLPKLGGGQVRVFRNSVTANDTPNFAPKGNIVASVRKGTGVLIMANDGVEITDNALSENATANVMILSYRFPQSDAKYNPLPRNVLVARNAHGRAGFDPQLPGGAQLAAAFGGSIPAVLWDGTGQNLNLAVTDARTLSLGLAAGAAPETAQPTPVDLSKTPPPARLKPVVLPPAMWARAK